MVLGVEGCIRITLKTVVATDVYCARFSFTLLHDKCSFYVLDKFFFFLSHALVLFEKSKDVAHETLPRPNNCPDYVFFFFSHFLLRGWSY